MTRLGTATVLRGDARALPLPDASVDAIVTDPPYGLEFMGREWDSFKPSSARLRTRVDGRTNPTEGRSITTTPEAYVAGAAFQSWCEQWAAEALRVLKPGGYLLAFGGARTWHRLTCAIEDAGFEIRDTIAWLYGSGFPKSLDVSKAIDAMAGEDREVVGVSPHSHDRQASSYQADDTAHGYIGRAEGPRLVTAPATDDARRWQGWGTALKPGYEPIVVARKPLAGTVAGNVLTHGTGALNIDGCRVGPDVDTRRSKGRDPSKSSAFPHSDDAWVPHLTHAGTEAGGRWPTNVVLSHPPLLDEHGEPVGDACGDGCVPGCPVVELDGQSGTLTSGLYEPHHARNVPKLGHGGVYGDCVGDRVRAKSTYGDSGGASRFFPTFRYEAKAPTDERPVVDGVAHPTVKPLDLMRWLCRLVTQPGGLILDQFAGSGTTVEAAMLEGFRVVGVEQDAAYLPLIRYRIDRAQRRTQPGISRLGPARPASVVEGQMDLFAATGDAA